MNFSPFDPDVMQRRGDESDADFRSRILRSLMSDYLNVVASEICSFPPDLEEAIEAAAIVTARLELALSTWRRQWHRGISKQRCLNMIAGDPRAILRHRPFRDAHPDGFLFSREAALRIARAWAGDE